MRLSNIALLLVVLCAATSGGCFGSNRGGGSADITGDWFICEDADCVAIGDDGIRFRSDGSWLQIDTEDQVVGEDPVCVELDTRGGTYNLTQDVLTTMTDQGDEVSFDTELRGDRLTLFDVPQSSSDGTQTTVDVAMLRVETFEAESCRTDAPPVANP